MLEYSSVMMRRCISTNLKQQHRVPLRGQAPFYIILIPEEILGRFQLQAWICIAALQSTFRSLRELMGNSPFKSSFRRLTNQTR